MISKVKKYLLIALVFFVLGISLSSCGDEPGLTGYGLIPSQDKLDLVYVDTRITPVESNLYNIMPDSVNFGDANRLFVGQYEGLSSTTLMRFYIYLDDSLSNALTNDSLNILESYIDMHPVYELGDESKTFDYQVNRINGVWYPPNFDKDSLDLLDINPIDISSKIDRGDTNLVSFDIDKQVVREWMLAKIDSNYSNYGIAIKPTAASERIFGFNALSIADSTLANFVIVVEKPGAFIDTIKTFTEIDVHVVEGEINKKGSNNVFLSAGNIKQANLSFNLDFIPDSIVISKAELELSIDTLSSSIGTIGSNVFVAEIFTDSLNRETNSSLIGFVDRADSGNVFAGDMTQFIQYWKEGSGVNEGMRISLIDQLNSVNSVAIKTSTSPDSSLHPRLKIYYAKGASK